MEHSKQDVKKLLKHLWYKFELSIFIKNVIIPSGIMVIGDQRVRNVGDLDSGIKTKRLIFIKLFKYALIRTI